MISTTLPLNAADHDSDIAHLAAQARQHFGGPVIAVVGDVGQSLACAMIRCVLGDFRGVAHADAIRDDADELAGLVSRLDEESDYALFALPWHDAESLGELAQICRPTLSVLVRGAGPREGRISCRQAVARLHAAMGPAGRMVLPADDTELHGASGFGSQRIAWYGRWSQCDVGAVNVRCSAGRLSFEVDGVQFVLPVWGRHNLLSALAAIAVGRLLGVTLEQARDRLAEFSPPPQRCAVLPTDDAVIIDDTAADGPEGFAAALDVLREHPATGRRLVVWGDDDEAEQPLDQAGEAVVARCGADALVACGPRAEKLVAGARAAGMPPRHTLACCTPDEAWPPLRQWVSAGDVVLVAGGRGRGMQRVVQQLRRAA
jgi:UDP-N-acetylmuramoyl-tripeptide--D-alanyl-D-alanine ligase